MNTNILSIYVVLVSFTPDFLWADEDGDKFSLEVDKLEYRARDGGDALVWDQAVTLSSEVGDISFASSLIYGLKETEFEEIELQLFLTRPIFALMDLHLGVRHDANPDPSRTYGLMGFSGVVFGPIDSSLMFFLSDKGDVSSRFEIGTEVPLAGKFSLQPTAELNFGFSGDPGLDLGSGLRDTELRLRLKYEISQNIAPYIGIQWAASLSDTADIVRDGGGDVDQFSILLGFALNF